MKKKYIGVEDLRFIFKALRWASQDRLSLSEAFGESKCGKEAKKEADKCLRLMKIVNEHLSSGGKGLVCSFDEVGPETESMLSLTDIKDGIASGDFVVDGNHLRHKRSL